MNEKFTKLNNNIEFFYERAQNTPRAAFCLNISLNEPEKSPGIYSVMARLFMQGTKSRTAEQIAQEFDKYAIEFSSECRPDYLRFRFLCLNEDFDKAIELVEDIVKNSTFEEFDKEIAKMQGEIIAELDSPRGKALENYYKTLFEGHCYGNTYTKILENINNIKKEDVINAYKNILENSKKVITFVGVMDFEKIFSDVDKCFGDLENSKNESACPLPKAICTKKEVEIIKPDANQSHIIQGWLVPTYKSEEYAALILLNIILGASGLSSRLFLELRDKKGLAYVVRSSYEPFALAANFSIYIATEPKNIETSLKGFNEEIAKIKDVLVGAEELENAKNNIYGKWAFAQETNLQKASIYAHNGILGLGFDFNKKIKEKVSQVTSEQIQNCARKYFNENFVLSILKP